MSMSAQGQSAATTYPMVFRRRGRPPSDRPYPLNIKVSQSVLQRVYARYDKTALSFASFLNLAAIRKWLPHFVNAS
jgi:hypothetical protein